MSKPGRQFGCRITPAKRRWPASRRFCKIQQAAHRRPGPQCLAGTAARQVGKQDIEVQGLDPRTRAARVIVEADYRMKLVGMGLEEGMPGVVSYLNLITLAPGQSPPPMTVLRWWFTLNYEAVQTLADRLAFSLAGQGVKVESENERLTAEGQQVHTGASEELNRRFARSFTEHFDGTLPKVSHLRRTAEPLRPGNGRGTGAPKKPPPKRWAGT